MRRGALTLATALATALALAACGSGDGPEATTPGGTSASTQAPATSGSVTSDSATSTGATEQTDNAEEAGTASDGVGTLFDGSVIHAISVDVDDAAYRAMLATYAASGDKEWIEATVTIDGVTYERVGLRLKGNSSLRDLDTTAAPEDLPWLIRLNKFVDGQDHQGYEDIVVRSNNSQSALNEAVALELLDAAGLASQAAAFARFSVNGSDETLRLTIEHPDDDRWYERVFDEAAGALYKAESTGDWSYRGDDPDSYTDVFDQEGGSDVADLTPLIDFLQFINESDDETFAAELPTRLDVDAFASYLAMMDLLDNFDDIDGPGNNAYLWWDAATERFTVVPWDMNLAFGAAAGPSGGQPPGAPRTGAPAGAPPGEGSIPTDATIPDGQFPTGRPSAPPADGARPDGPADGGVPGGGGRFNRTNPLVERFLANEEFSAMYDRALERLRTDLFTGGVAGEILGRATQLLISDASDLVDPETVSRESEAIAATIADA